MVLPADVRQPLGEAAHELGLVGLEGLLAAAEAAAEQVVGNAAEAPATL